MITTLVALACATPLIVGAQSDTPPGLAPGGNTPFEVEEPEDDEETQDSEDDDSEDDDSEDDDSEEEESEEEESEEEEPEEEEPEEEEPEEEESEEEEPEEEEPEEEEPEEEEPEEEEPEEEDDEEEDDEEEDDEEESTGVAALEGSTARQRSVAIALQGGCDEIDGLDSPTAGQEDLQATCERILDLDQEARDERLDALLPEQAAVMGRASLPTTRQQHANISQRMGQLRSGITGLEVSDFHADGHWGTPGVASSRGGARGQREYQLFSARGLGAFVSGSANFANRDETSREPGYRSQSFSLTAGLDRRFGYRTIGGLALGLSQTSADLRGNSGHVDVEGVSLSLYGTHLLPQDFYVDVMATVGRNRYDTERRVFPADDEGPGQVAKADPDGTTYALGAGFGRDFFAGPWTVSLQSRADYVKVNIDSYDESPGNPDEPGFGSLLHVESRGIDALTVEGAVQATYAYPVGRGVLLPTARVGVEHELSGSNDGIRARFLEDPGRNRFSIGTDSSDSTWANVGVGVSGHFPHGQPGFMDGLTSAHLFLESVEGLSEERIYRVELGLRIEF